jgi:hypothetical protein
MTGFETGRPSSGETIDRLLRKWLRLLTHPLTAADQKAGFRHDISILQAEFSLTQMLDRPVHGLNCSAAGRA